MRKLLLATTALLTLSALPAKAEFIDPLLGQCATCVEANVGGNDVTTTTDLSAFGFAAAPPDGGDLQLKFLIPTSYGLAAAQSFAANAVLTSNGTTYSLGLFSSTPWTSGFLETDYLNNTLANGAPKNPIDAWSGATGSVVGTFDGYFLVTAETGPHTLLGPGAALGAANTFDLQTAFFAGGLIAGNLFTSAGVVSTAQSGALFDGTPAVPEPATWALMLLGFIGVAGMGAKKQWKGFRLA